LFGESNGLDTGPVSSFLPILTAVEELLIARVYVYLQVVRVRGQQYRYTSHGGEYLSRQFTKRYTVRRSAIALWLYFLKASYSDYRDVEICSIRLISLPKNGSILDQLPYINELESDNSVPVQ
ncbi:hypothetical protein AOQ84DRAFT_274823, partial [Glonium stellatum]